MLTTAYINIDSDAKTGTVVDPKDYAALGIDLAGVNAKRIGTATGPDLIAMISGVLIDLGAGDTVSAEFDVPVGTDGKVLVGAYSLLSSLNMSVDAITCGSVFAGTGDGYFNMVGVDWSNVLQAGDLITITNSLAANNGVKTVVSATLVGLDTQVVVAEALNEELVGSSKITFDVTRTNDATMSDQYSGCDLKTPVVSGVYDAYNTQFGILAFSDATIFPSTHVLQSRAWSIAYPQNLSPAPPVDPIVDTKTGINLPENETMSFTAIATQQWNYRMTQIVNVEQPLGLVYTYTATTGAQPFNVYWVKNLCALNECYETLLAKEEQDILANGSSALTAPLGIISRKMLLLLYQKTCGQDQACVATTAAEIQTLMNETGECSCDCGCGGNDENPGNVWVNNASQFTSPGFIQSVTGSMVNNTDPFNPIINLPVSNQIALSADIPQLPEAGNVQEALEALAAIGGSGYHNVTKAEFDDLIATEGLIAGNFYHVAEFYLSDPFEKTFDVLVIADSINSIQTAAWILLDNEMIPTYVISNSTLLYKATTPSMPLLAYGVLNWVGQTENPVLPLYIQTAGGERLFTTCANDANVIRLTNVQRLSDGVFGTYDAGTDTFTANP